MVDSFEPGHEAPLLPAGETVSELVISHTPDPGAQTWASLLFSKPDKFFDATVSEVFESSDYFLLVWLGHASESHLADNRTREEVVRRMASLSLGKEFAVLFSACHTSYEQLDKCIQAEPLLQCVAGFNGEADWHQDRDAETKFIVECLYNDEWKNAAAASEQHSQRFVYRVRDMELEVPTGVAQVSTLKWLAKASRQDIFGWVNRLCRSDPLPWEYFCQPHPGIHITASVSIQDRLQGCLERVGVDLPEEHNVETLRKILQERYLTLISPTERQALRKTTEGEDLATMMQLCSTTPTSSNALLPASSSVCKNVNTKKRKCASEGVLAPHGDAGSCWACLEKNKRQQHRRRGKKRHKSTCVAQGELPKAQRCTKREICISNGELPRFGSVGMCWACSHTEMVSGW